MKKLLVFVLLGGFVLPSTSSAIDLKQAKFTQVVNHVDVISTSDKSRHTATVNDIFKTPDVLRTGPNARAELVASDDTITRVGANTVFSFDPASRTIDLQQGSLLFHSPHGKGGGTIHTGSATASVLGTTIIVTTTPNGGFKVLVLEGEAEIRFLNGLHITLTPGQMTFVLPGGGTSPIVVFRLDDETRGSLLVSGFNNPLPSLSKIETEITRQLLLLLNNKVQDVDLVVGDNATPNAVQVRMDLGGPPPPNPNASIIGPNHTPNQPLPISYDPPNNIPLDPVAVRNTSFSPPGDFSEGLTFLGLGNPASGFVGNNIDIDTGFGTPIDLSSFAGKSDFDIMAKGDLRIWQSVKFTGEPVETSIDSGVPDTIALFAGGQMLIAPDSTLKADTGTFGLVAGSFGVLDTDDGTVDIPDMLENISVYNCGGDVDILSLSDLTIEGMNWSDTVYAAGAVNIQSDGTLTLGTDVTVSQLDNGHNVVIDADGDVALTAGLTTGGDMNVEDTEVIAGDSDFGGSIIINAGGNVYMDYYSSLTAYSGEDGVGDVHIFADGDIDIYESSISAGGNVDIGAGGTLNIGEDPYYNDVSITATGSVTLSGGGDANIYDTYIDAGGDVNISSGGTISFNAANTLSGGGNVDVEYSEIYAGDNGNLGQPSITGGAVNIHASNGTVYLYDDEIFAYGSESTIAENVNVDTPGDVNIYADGYVDVEHTDVYQDGSVYVNAGDEVYLYDVYNYDYNTSSGGDDNSSDTYLTDWNITAGSYVEIDADANVQIYNSDIEADDGDVDINSYGTVELQGTSTLTGGGNITIGNSYIQAWDSVNVTADDGTVCIKDGSTLYAENGDVNVTADSGKINVHDSTIEANGSVYLSAGDNININDSPISATSGNSPKLEGESSGDQVSISSGGELTVNGTFGDNYYGYDIGADYKICLSGDDGVSIDDALITTLDGNSSDKIRITGDGEIDITDGSELYSDGSVTVEAYDGNVNVLDSEIVANGSDVYVSADNGKLTVNAGHVFQNTSSPAGSAADIYANGTATLDGDNVAIQDTAVYAGNEVDVTGEDGNVLVEDADIRTGGGNVNITADSGNLTLDSGIADYGVYIKAGSSVNLNADDDVNIYDTQIYADDGGVTINSGGDMNLGDGNFGYGVYVEADGGDVNMSAGGDVDIYDSEIDANSGDVTIAANGKLTIEGGDHYSSISGNNVTLSAMKDGVYISDETVTAVNGDLTINAGSSSEEPVSVGKNSGHFTPANVKGGSAFGPGLAPFIPADLTIPGIDIDEESQTITDPGSVDLNAVDTVTVNNSTLTAQGGHMGISGAGAIAITGSHIYGDSGYADITSSGSTVNINDSYIYASGDVNIESSDTLTFQNSSEIVSYGIDGVSLKSDNADVDVYGSYIYAYDGSVNIKALNLPGAGDNPAYPGAAVDIENTYIYASGDVNVESSGSLTVGTSSGYTISANGAVNLTSDYGDVEVDNYDIEASGDNGVNVTAFGGLTMQNDSDVEAYNGSVTLDAKDNVDLNNDSIYADDGDVKINSTYSSVDIEGSYISASGDVNIEGAGDLTLGENFSDTIEAYGSVYLTSDYGDVNLYYVDAGYNSINTYNGDIYISANFGDVLIDNAYVEARSGNNVDISDSPLSATGNVYINAYGGNIDIHAGGDVTIEDQTDVYLGGDITIEDSSSVTAGAGDAGAGSLNITTGSTLSISGDNVNLYDSSFEGNNIEINDSSLTANNGDVNIKNTGSVTIDWNSGYDTSDDSVDVNNISISDAYITANKGSIYIQDLGELNLPDFDESSSVTANQISISDSTVAANSGSVTISTKGDIDISSSVISATAGLIPVGETQGSGDSISISAGGTVTINGEYGDYKGYDYDIGADSSVCIRGDNEVDINNAWIQTLDGNSGDKVKISSGGDVTVDDSFIGSSGGDVSVKSGGMLTVNAGRVYETPGSPVAGADGFDILAGDNVTLDGGSGVAVVDTAVHAGNEVDITGTDGNVLVEDADIETVNGDVNITADYGDLTLDSGSAEYGAFISAGGTVNLNADGNVSISDANINANDDVNINTGSSDSFIVSGVKHSGHFIPANKGSVAVTPHFISAVSGSGSPVIDAYQINTVNDINLDSQDILDPGSIDLSADGTVSISGNSTLSADGGHVTISALEAVAISDSSIYAYGGDATISSFGSTMDIEDSLIAANGNVSIYSDGTLTLGNVTGDTIEAIGGVSLTSISSDVDVYDSDIYAYGGDVDITASSGAVDIEDNDIYAYSGGVSITAAGDAYLDENDIYAYDGDIVITSSGSTVEIYDGYLYASGDVKVTSSGMLTVNADNSFDGNLSEDIYAGDSVTLDAGTSASVVDTAIYAQNNVTITGEDGNVLVEDADIETGGGDVTITANFGSLTLDSGDAEYGVYIEAGGSVSLSADLDVDINDSSIYADGGDVTITSNGGNVNVQNNSDIEASGDLTISSEGTVELTKLGSVSSGVDVDVSESSLTADTGAVGIYSYFGNVDVEYSDITAGSSVNIEGGVLDAEGSETVTLNHDTIEAKDSVTIFAQGDVAIYGSQPVEEGVITPASSSPQTADISAYGDNGGSVTIESLNASVDIENASIASGSTHNVAISAETRVQAGKGVAINAQGGSVTISAAEDLTMFNSEIDLGGNISISDSTLTAEGNDVEDKDVDIITSGGALSITAEGTENVSGVGISGNNINISDSAITANIGDINIENKNSLSLSDTTDFDLSQANNIDITSGSTIAANNGNVTISTDGSVDVDNSTISANSASGTVGITSDTTTIANGSTVQAFYLNVNSPDGILIDGTSGGGVHLSGNTMTLTANSGDVNVNTADLGNYATVNIQGHTVNFDNDNFSSTSSYNVTVFNHDYHINDGHVAGSANFNNDTLDQSTSIINTGTAGLANQPNNGGIVLGGSGVGIHVN